MGGPHGAGAGRRRRKPLLRLERLRRSGGGRLRKRLRTTAAGLRIAHLQDAVELLEPPLQRNVQLPDGLRSGLLQHHRHGRRSVGRTQIHHFDVRHVGTGHRLRGGVYGRHLRQLVQQLGLRLALLRLGVRPLLGLGRLVQSVVEPQLLVRRLLSVLGASALGTPALLSPASQLPAQQQRIDPAQLPQLRYAVAQRQLPQLRHVGERIARRKLQQQPQQQRRRLLQQRRPPQQQQQCLPRQREHVQQ